MQRGTRPGRRRRTSDRRRAGRRDPPAAVRRDTVRRGSHRRSRSRRVALARSGRTGRGGLAADRPGAASPGAGPPRLNTTVERMRAVVITEPGGPEVLEVRDVPAPVLQPDEVLVQVAATAVNRADLLQRQGNYAPPKGASPYPGLECSGTIKELGEAVAGWQVGDQVCALLSGGGYAEQVAVPVGQLLPVPKGLSLVDAAALPEVTCTVWSMVFGERAGRLQPGERFLVHGGSSGIGTMAIQLAKQRGATVFTTAGTPRKVKFCRELGADFAINYREQV